MLLFDLKKNATSLEAKTRAGHNKPQWVNFYRFTSLEVNRLLKAQPDLTWPSVPADVLMEMHGRVTVQLRGQHIPEVSYDVFEWRIARAMQYRIPAKEKRKDGVEVGTAPVLD